MINLMLESNFVGLLDEIAMKVKVGQTKDFTTFPEPLTCNVHS